MYLLVDALSDYDNEAMTCVPCFEIFFTFLALLIQLMTREIPPALAL